jgi:DNA replication protein DnaC
MKRVKQIASDPLQEQLRYLKLSHMADHYQEALTKAANKQWSHLDLLTELVDREVYDKKDRAVQRRIRQARFPVVKTLDTFNWNWPASLNRLQVENLFRLDFVEQKANVIFMGGVGLGKTHLSTALAYQACLKGYTVLFTTAIDVINALAAAQAAGRFQQELKKYLRPALLVLDELGYLPIDKHGADLLFQVISHRYERGAVIISTNRAFKEWPLIFNNDSTLTSALLDRLLHHAETVLIEGKSYRMKEVVE